MIKGKNVDVIEPQSLYKWAKTWGKIQKNFYTQSVMIRREKQIADFIYLNGYVRPFVIKDTDVLADVQSVEAPNLADIIVVTDQKFSRLPCVAIIENIKQLMNQCPAMVLCINRHYLNIDHAFMDHDLDDHFPLAITQWLKKNLLQYTVIDMSLDYLDKGDYFTWVIPDRIYFIK